MTEKQEWQCPTKEIEQALIVRNKYIIDNKLFHTIQTYIGENNG